MTRLEELLKYENEPVLIRFQKKFPVDREEAQDIFRETIKWLYLCRADNPGGVELFINNDMLIIDEMWHNFILFTKDYQEFCSKYFKSYIHHFPDTSAPQKPSKKTLAILRAKLKAQMSFIYDHLGEETLLKWYHEYPERYKQLVS